MRVFRGNNRGWFRLAIVAGALSFVFGGCELFGGGGGGSGIKPLVSLKEVSLVRSPSWSSLAAHYCPSLGSSLLGSAATPLCTDLWGPAPANDAMEFAFDLDFLAGNSNPFPIPTTEILVALNVFTGDQYQAKDMLRLGAICFTFCSEGDPDCAQPPGGEACQAHESDVMSWEDLPGATLEGLLDLANDIATGQDIADNFSQRFIPANATDFGFKVRFAVGVDPMLQLIEKLAGDWLTQITTGKAISFDIPYESNGTLWFQVPYLGRAGLGFGPLPGSWSVL